MLSNRAWAFEIKSSAFADGEYIPDKYTCKSVDISPPLEWSGAPEGTKSFVLICDDPDAPMGTWVHWVAFNIPADKTLLQEDIPKQGRLSDGTIQGLTNFRRVGYGGPCPPPGKPHRYFFELYALDTALSLDESAKKRDVEKAIEGHILGEAKIIGLYKR